MAYRQWDELCHLLSNNWQQVIKKYSYFITVLCSMDFITSDINVSQPAEICCSASSILVQEGVDKAPSPQYDKGCSEVSNLGIILSDIIVSQPSEIACSASSSPVQEGGDTASSIHSDKSCSVEPIPVHMGGDATSTHQADITCPAVFMPKHNNRPYSLVHFVFPIQIMWPYSRDLVLCLAH